METDPKWTIDGTEVHSVTVWGWSAGSRGHRYAMEFLGEGNGTSAFPTRVLHREFSGNRANIIRDSKAIAKNRGVRFLDRTAKTLWS